MQGENERQWKKVNGNTYDISSIKRVTKKFLEVSRCSRAKQRQKNVQKSVLHVQSCFSANYTYCCFHRSPALPSPLNITRFYILFEQTINIIASLLALAKSIYYVTTHFVTWRGVSCNWRAYDHLRHKLLSQANSKSWNWNDQTIDRNKEAIEITTLQGQGPVSRKSR